MATLVSLVCDDDLDEIEDQLSEDHFGRDEHLRSRTPSEISLVDIRSYRYQKLTNNYPTLKHHLLNYIIPIAGAQVEDINKSGDPVLKLITSAISDKLKACMLSLHSSIPFHDVVISVLDSLIVNFKWLEILHILESFPSTVLHNEPKYIALKDFSLESIIFSRLSQTVAKLEADEISKCLKHFYDPVKACHILLSIYRKLPLDVVQDLFHSFYNDDIRISLKEAISHKQKEINLYFRVSIISSTYDEIWVSDY